MEEKVTWTCFHCGFATSDTAEAEAHFGDLDNEQALCQWWLATSAEDRNQELQSAYRELNAEREENAALKTKIEGLEYRIDGIEAQISSRFKGCRSIDEAWHKYDAMEGRALAAEEKLRRFEAMFEDVPLGKEVEEASGYLIHHDVMDKQYLPLYLQCRQQPHIKDPVQSATDMLVGMWMMVLRFRKAVRL